MATDLMACRNGFALLVLCVPALVSAQALTDPTKPPAEISAPQGAPPGAPSGTPPGAAVPEGNALQTIFISSGRRAAIIDGQTVELGAKHGDVRLIEVNESGVVLEGAQGRQALALFPGVEIRKKSVLHPVKHKVKRTARKENPVNQSTSDAGKKEEK